MALTRRRFCAWPLATSPLLLGVHVRASQAYPDKPVRIIVPFTPSGGTDFAARVFSARLGERLGQPVTVENKPGAGSTLGTSFALKSPPDGYTLLVISGSYVVNPSLYKLNFDPIRDIAPVIQLTQGGFVLAVNPNVPARSLAELLELMRQRPGELTYASSGQGGQLQVITEYLLSQASVKARHVPYRGTGPAVSDVLAGNVDMIFAGTEALMQFVASGKLRALAVSTSQRLPAYPDVPTAAEAGVPDYDVVAWHGMLAPRDTPPEIVATLNRHLNVVVHDTNINAKIAPQGVGGAGGTPEEFGALLKTEITRYARVVRKAGIKAGD